MGTFECVNIETVNLCKTWGNGRVLVSVSGWDDIGDYSLGRETLMTLEIFR